MRSPAGKKSLLARFGAPVALSLVLHGLFVVGLWQLPTSHTGAPADADPTLAPDDNKCTLRLDDASRPLKAAAKTQNPREAASIAQAVFEVKLVDPAPAPAPLPNSFNAAPGLPKAGFGGPASSSGVGEGNNKGGDPCALGDAATARSVVYVVDRSISMGFHNALGRARREVLASLRRLAPSTRVQVIAYNREAEPLRIDGQYGLHVADEKTVSQVAEFVTALQATGGTNHGNALRRAVVFHPDLIYFLTDADDVSLDDVRLVTRLANHHTVINTVEINGDRTSRAEGPLHKLAADNGGTYRRIDPEE